MPTETPFRLGLGVFTSAMHWSEDPLAELVALVQHVERLGFDFVAFPQHVSVLPESATALGRNWRDPLILSSATVASTATLVAVTTVVVAPLYGESLLRQAATTLTWLGHGRFELGLGAGYLPSDFESEEQFADRFRRLRATAESLREQAPALPLWVGGGISAARLARRLNATWAPSAQPAAAVQEQIAAATTTVPLTDWLDASHVPAEVARWRAAGAAGLTLRLRERSPARLAASLDHVASALRLSQR